jgi:hypothetical protein
MPLPTSGPLSLTDIQTEFGGSNPIGLNEYYAGGGLVPAGTTGTNGAVPSSGQIAISNFYGTQAYYTLSKSLRFRRSATAFLNRTPATTTNRRTYTWSGWVKLGQLSVSRNLFCGYEGDENFSTNFGFNSLNQFFLGSTVSGSQSNGFYAETIAVFRDPSAWYHVVVTVDTTQASVTNALKLYINNVQQTLQNFGGGTPGYGGGQNQQTFINLNTAVQRIGQTSPPNDGRFDGYMAEVNFIDGQALTPSSFGAANANLGGMWQPAKYTGTYGTNGYYLQFTNTTSTTTLVADSSGNGNNWTPNNISLTAGVTYDSMTDVPTLTNATTANYCVLNPLDKNTSITASNGNLTVTTPSGFVLIRSTMFLTSDKYYWEVTCTTTGNGFLGISSAAESLSSRGAETANSATVSTANGNLRTSGSDSAYGSSVSNGDVMIFALDMTSGRFWAGKNGTWFASGNPAAGTNAGKTGLTVAVSPSISLYDNENYSANFGQRPFAYTPPTGFLALNAFNI